MRLAWLDCSPAAVVSIVAGFSPTFRFSRFGLRLDQRTLHEPHRCAVQSKVARRRAEPQLQHTAAGLALLSAAGPAGKSDVLRHRDTAAERPVVAGKRGRRLRPLACSPPWRRRALLGNDGGWRRGDVASSPRVVRRIARRESSARSWSRPVDRSEAECWSIPLRPARRFRAE